MRLLITAHVSASEHVPHPVVGVFSANFIIANYGSSQGFDNDDGSACTSPPPCAILSGAGASTARVSVFTRSPQFSIRTTISSTLLTASRRTMADTTRFSSRTLSSSAPTMPRYGGRHASGGWLCHWQYFYEHFQNCANNNNNFIPGHSNRLTNNTCAVQGGHHPWGQ